MRESEPSRLNAEIDWEGSFKNLLMTAYLAMTKNIFATPILKNFNPKDFGINLPLKKKRLLN